MASLPFTLVAGKPPQSFPRQLDVGTTLVNTGTFDVWISEVPGMESGIGMPLRATGSLEITTAGSYYAVVDASATVGATVQVIISSDVTGYTDPIAVATATATALVTAGVPNTLIMDFLGAYTIPPASTSPNIDVTKYSSLFIQGGGQPVRLYWYSETGSLISSDFIPDCDDLWVVCQGNVLVLGNNTVAPETFSLYGTNRTLTRYFESKANHTTAIAFLGMLATVGGTDYPFTLVNPLPTGPCEVIIYIIGTAEGYITGDNGILIDTNQMRPSSPRYLYERFETIFPTVPFRTQGFTFACVRSSFATDVFISITVTPIDVR